MIFSLACFGSWHVETFLLYGLPSLAPQLRRGDRLRVHTTVRDADTLQAHLPRQGHVLIGDFSGQTSHAAAWAADVALARQLGEPIALIWPDVYWGGNCWSVYRGLLDSGCSAVWQHLPRVDLEAASGALMQLPTANRALADIALRAEHHLSWAYRFSSTCYPAHAELLNWRVPGAGIVSRMLAATPLVLRPDRVVLNNQMLLVDKVDPGLGFITDSDEAIALSLSRPGQDFHLLTPDHTPDVAEMRDWQRDYFSPSNAELSRHTFRLHDGDVVEGAWSDAEREGQRFVQELVQQR